MPSKLPVIKANTSQDNIAKMKVIAEYNKRSVAKELELIIEKHIAEFEREHGEIPVPEKTPWQKQMENISNITQQSINKTLSNSLKNGIELGNDAGDQVKKKTKKQN